MPSGIQTCKHEKVISIQWDFSGYRLRVAHRFLIPSRQYYVKLSITSQFDRQSRKNLQAEEGPRQSADVICAIPV